MFSNYGFITFLISFLISSPLLAQYCSSWSAPEILGELPRDDDFAEQSGFDTSLLFPNRLYHISEAKKKLNLYITKKDGSADKKIRLFKVQKGDLKAEDVEDISVASCFGVNTDPTRSSPLDDKRSCVFIGDIGGGKDKARNSLRLVIIREKKKYLSHETPEKILRFSYPDNEFHDAEAMAIHPSTGDLFIITKVLFLDRENGQDNSFSGPAQVFKLSHQDWAYDIPSGKNPVLTYVGEINMDLLARTGVKKRYMHLVITGMDISADGSHFAFSTYRDLFQIKLNLATATKAALDNLNLQQNVSRIELEKPERLIQQEALAYDQDGSLLYSSEFKKGEPGDPNYQQTIMKLNCQPLLP